MVGGRRNQRGGASVFGCRLRKGEDINSVKEQGILGDLGTGQTGFCVLDFTVPQGAPNGSEDDDVVYGGVHIDNNCVE